MLLRLFLELSEQEVHLENAASIGDLRRALVLIVGSLARCPTVEGRY
jgi:hypothetical protein